MIFAGLAVQVTFALPAFASGNYFASGTATSTNLLSGSSASLITNFYYNLSSLPGNSSVTIQFSSNGTTWYSAAGVLNGSTSLGTTGGANISLSALNWSGTSFYYAMTLNSTSDNTGTPIMSGIRLDFNTASGYGGMFVVNQGGHVGIGTTTPLSTLDVNGGVAIGSYAGVNIAPQNGLLVSGYVGVGSTSPSQALSVTGNGYFSGSLTAMSTLSVFGITNTGSITSTGTSTAAAFVATSTTATSTFMGAVGIGTSTPMSILSVVGTSTFAGNLLPALDNTYSLGSSVTNRWKTVWSQTLNTGDLVFGNNFRLIEATTTDGSFATTTGAAMYWRNQFGENIFNLDQNGNLALAGDICTSNVNCFDKIASTTEAVTAQVASLSSLQDTLASTTASTTALTLRNLELGTSLANSFATMNANFGVLDTRISDLASTTAGLALMVGESANSAVAQLISSSTLMEALASSTMNLLLGDSTRPLLVGATSSATTSPSSFIGRVANAVIEYLQSTAMLAFTKITSTLAVFTNVETQNIDTQTASVTDGLNMTDSATGQIYCVRITNGDFARIAGKCGAVGASSTPVVNAEVPVVNVQPDPINFNANSSTTATTTFAVLPISTSTTPIFVNATSTPMPVATTTIPIVMPIASTTPVVLPVQPSADPTTPIIEPVGTPAPAPVTTPAPDTTVTPNPVVSAPAPVETPPATTPQF